MSGVRKLDIISISQYTYINGNVFFCTVLRYRRYENDLGSYEKTENAAMK